MRAVGRRCRVALPACVGAATLTLLRRSWRMEVAGLESMEAMRQRGERVLIVFWHGEYVPFFSLLQGRGARVFSSRSFRGEVIAAICNRLGHRCTTIPDHDGEAVLKLMRKSLAGDRLAALVPDGPLGPARRVKSGVVRLAADLGMTLLPASAASRPRLVLARRWDRLELPLPFARVRLVLGEPIMIPGDLGRRSLGWWQDHVREALDAVGAEADAGLKRREGGGE